MHLLRLILAIGLSLAMAHFPTIIPFVVLGSGVNVFREFLRKN